MTSTTSAPPLLTAAEVDSIVAQLSPLLPSSASGAAHSYSATDIVELLRSPQCKQALEALENLLSHSVDQLGGVFAQLGVDARAAHTGAPPVEALLRAFVARAAAQRK